MLQLTGSRCYLWALSDRLVLEFDLSKSFDVVDVFLWLSSSKKSIRHVSSATHSHYRLTKTLTRWLFFWNKPFHTNKVKENSMSIVESPQWPWSSFVSVTIDSIHEVQEGKKSEIFRRYADNRFDPNCCFSIYHGERVKSLDLVSTNAEEARTWITGLKYLMAGISDEDSFARRQRTRDQYPFGLGLVCVCYVCVYSLKDDMSDYY